MHFIIRLYLQFVEFRSINMEEKSMKRVEGFDELSVVAVAITGSRKTKHVITWALDKFVPEGLVYFKLLHVRPLVSSIPTPSKS